MKNLSIAFLAAVSLMSFAGCKKGKGGEALAKMTEFKELMCKCAAGDKACADKVATDYAKAMTDMAAADKGEAAKAPDPEEAKKFAPVMKEYTDCMMKAQGMGGAMTPPAGDKPMDKPADKPADPAMAPPAGGDKPADPAAAPPAGGDKPAAGSN